MVNEKKESFAEYVKNFIIDSISDYENCRIYGGVIVNLLTEDINANGTATFSAYEAIEYLKEWWDEVAEFYDFMEENYGQIPCNPFKNPEAFMVCMITEGVRRVLIKHEFLAEYWNNGVIFKEKLVEDIKAYVNTVDNIEF